MANHLYGRRAGAGVVVLGLLALCGGCGQKTALPALVLARVGSHAITEKEFMNEVDRRRRHGQECTNKSAVLQEMVTREALLQRAHASGLADDPDVQREVSNLLIGKLMDRELKGAMESATVSPEEIKGFYEANTSAYTRPAQSRLSVLKLDVAPQATPERKNEARARMDEARRRVVANPPRGRGSANTGFGNLAVEFSDDQASRYRGGDIGWVDAARLPARWPHDVLETGLSLPMGQYSGVLESTGGVYLVTKTDSRPESRVPLSEVEGVIRQHLLVTKRQAVESAFRSDAIRLAAARIDEKALESIKWSVTAPRDEGKGPLPVPGSLEGEVKP